MRPPRALLAVLLLAGFTLAAGAKALPVPEIKIEGLDPLAQEVLERTHNDLQAAISAPGVTDATLSEAYATAARVYHAYQLQAPAEACYRNAATLAPKDFRWPYLLGHLLRDAGRLEEAAQSFQAALRRDPDSAVAMIQLARLQLALNRPRPAVALLEQARKTDGFQAPASYELGNAALSQRDYATAAERFREVLTLQPKASRAHYSLAMALRGLGRLEEARRELGLRGDKAPSMPDPLITEVRTLSTGVGTHQYRARQAVDQHRFDEAAKEFRAMLELQPDNVDAQVGLSRCLYLQGDKDASEQELRRAVAQNPDHARANYFLGRALEARGKPDEAAEHYRRTIALDPKHGGAQFFYAGRLMARAEYAEAAEHYAIVVGLAPRDLSARVMEAVARIAAGGQDAAARARLESTVKLFPKEQAPRQILARLLAASPEAKVRDGWRAFELGRDLFAESHSMASAATLAMAYAELGDFDQATAFQQAAIDTALQYGQLGPVLGLQAQLKEYQDQKPCRRPWSKDDPLYQSSSYAVDPDVGGS